MSNIFRTSANTRAQTVRQRRGQTPARQASASASTAGYKSAVNSQRPSVVKPAVLPSRNKPLPTSRNSNTARSIPLTANTRKIHYHVSPNGVETRSFAFPTLHFNWQWVSGIMSVLLLVAVLLLTNMTMFNVNTVSVDGLQRLTAEDLAPVIQAESGSIFTLDRQSLVNSLAMAFPELTDIRLKVTLPNAVKLSLIERQPVIAWSTGDSTVWVDPTGVVFTPRGEAGSMLNIYSDDAIPLTTVTQHSASPLDYVAMVIYYHKYPLTPEKTTKYMDPSTLKAAMDLSAQMPEGATLVYDAVSGMGWQDPRGWKVYFGTILSNIQFKNVEYQAIVDRLSTLGITPTTISVEYPDAPYFRTE